MFLSCDRRLVYAKRLRGGFWFLALCGLGRRLREFEVIRRRVKGQNLKWINGAAFDAHFIVQMRRGGAARAACARDDLPALDARADFDKEARQVRVAGRYAAAVIDDYHIAVAVIPCRELDYSGLACAYSVARAGFDVYASVKASAARERVAAITEAAADLSR